MSSHLSISYEDLSIMPCEAAVLHAYLLDESAQTMEAIHGDNQESKGGIDCFQYGVNGIKRDINLDQDQQAKCFKILEEIRRIEIKEIDPATNAHSISFVDYRHWKR